MKPNKILQSLKHIIDELFAIFLFITGCSLSALAQKTFVINNYANPLKNFSVPLNKESYPFFVDIDHDGDLDCFTGEYTGQLSKIYFYRNDGTTKAPLFKQVNGASNPLNKV